MKTNATIKGRLFMAGIAVTVTAALGCGSQELTGPADGQYDSEYGGYTDTYGQQTDGTDWSYYHDPVNNFSVTNDNGNVVANQWSHTVGGSETGSTNAYRSEDGTFYIHTSPPPPNSDSPY